MGPPGQWGDANRPNGPNRENRLYECRYEGGNSCAKLSQRPSDGISGQEMPGAREEIPNVGIYNMYGDSDIWLELQL